MSHDDAYAFLEIGRHIERADMTTRVLDVQAGILMASPTEALRPYADLTWMSVLRVARGRPDVPARSAGAMVSGPGRCGSCCGTRRSPARSSTA